MRDIGQQTRLRDGSLLTASPGRVTLERPVIHLALAILLFCAGGGLLAWSISDLAKRGGQWVGNLFATADSSSQTSPYFGAAVAPVAVVLLALATLGRRRTTYMMTPEVTLRERTLLSWKSVRPFRPGTLILEIITDRHNEVVQQHGWFWQRKHLPPPDASWNSPEAPPPPLKGAWAWTLLIEDADGKRDVLVYDSRGTSTYLSPEEFTAAAKLIAASSGWPIHLTTTHAAIPSSD